MIDQEAAHERIMYEKYLASTEDQGLPSQKQLFPETMELPRAKSETLKKIRDKINLLGFEIEEFGNDTFVIHGVPVGLENADSGKALIEKLLFQYEQNLEFQLGINENLARSLAISTSINKGISLDAEEMRSVIDQLFACSVPYKSPSGKKCFISIDIEEIKNRFSE